MAYNYIQNGRNVNNKYNQAISDINLTIYELKRAKEIISDGNNNNKEIANLLVMIETKIDDLVKSIRDLNNNQTIISNTAARLQREQDIQQY